MKKFLALISVGFLLFSCSEMKSFFSTKEQKLKVTEDFVQGSEDIPLLAGMSKISSESVGFDSNAGSIISSSYATKSDLKKVKKFYIETLPQMGWKQVKGANKHSISFKREKEKLEIDFSDEDGKKIVKFFISSAI